MTGVSTGPHASRYWRLSKATGEAQRPAAQRIFSGYACARRWTSTPRATRHQTKARAPERGTLRDQAINLSSYSS